MYVRQLRLRYIGHVARYPESRWVGKVICSKPVGCTKSTRRVTWQKDIADELAYRNLSFADCLDKDGWRKTCDDCKGKPEKPDTQREFREEGSLRALARTQGRRRVSQERET